MSYMELKEEVCRSISRHPSSCGIARHRRISRVYRFLERRDRIAIRSEQKSSLQALPWPPESLSRRHPDRPHAPFDFFLFSYVSFFFFKSICQMPTTVHRFRKYSVDSKVILFFQRWDAFVYIPTTCLLSLFSLVGKRLKDDIPMIMMTVTRPLRTITWAEFFHCVRT